MKLLWPIETSCLSLARIKSMLFSRIDEFIVKCRLNIWKFEFCFVFCSFNRFVYLPVHIEIFLFKLGFGHQLIAIAIQDYQTLTKSFIERD